LSSSKHKKLGGFADIFQSESLDGSIVQIRLDKIYPSGDQPRRDRKHAVTDLAASIKKDGLLSPIVVTKEGEKYRIIAGERRFHAVSSLGWKEVECRIISREERDYFRIAVIENLQRENLSAEEEAAAFLRLKKQENYSDAELAAIVGKSRNYITEILGIASLPEEVLHACKNTGIDNKNFMIQVVQAHKKGNWKEFLKAYESGTLKTVREAREFNKGEGDKKEPKKPHSQKKSKFADIFVKNHQIIIECHSSDEAEELFTELKKLLKSRI